MATRTKTKTRVVEEEEDPEFPKKPWTELEMKILTECWLDTSEDPYVGKNQSGESFWNKVMESYNAQVEFKRRLNQATSKWRKIRLHCGKFNAIHARYEKDRASGENDAQVMEQSRRAFKAEVGVAFSMYECWLLLKDKPLISAPSGVDIMGRRRGPGGEGPSINVESDEDTPAYEPVDLGNENEFLQPDPYQRPAKTKTPRTSASSDAGSSRSSASDIAARLEKLGTTKQELLETQKQSLEIIREEEKKRTMFTALSFMGQTELDEDEKKFLKSAKKKLMSEYRSYVEDEDV